MPRTTVIYAPHPDDETLYLAGYITFAAQRGDRLILVAVTDGGASGARPSTWTQADLMAVRRTEQTLAWTALTKAAPESHIIRLGLPDGGVSRARVTPIAASLEKIYAADGIEHYVGASTLSTQAPDHRNVAQGVLDAKPGVVRFAQVPGATGGTLYKPTAGSAAFDAAKEADDAYLAFGHRSVAGMFNALRTSGYSSRVFAP